jgi:hypothetical protein
MLADLRRLAGVILAQSQSSGMTQSTAKQHKVEKKTESTLLPVRLKIPNQRLSFQHDTLQTSREPAGPRLAQASTR